jgi:hypothetical protein
MICCQLLGARPARGIDPVAIAVSGKAVLLDSFAHVFEDFLGLGRDRRARPRLEPIIAAATEEKADESRQGRQDHDVCMTRRRREMDSNSRWKYGAFTQRLLTLNFAHRRAEGSAAG